MSPEAMQMVTFWMAASSNACVTAVIQLVGNPFEKQRCGVVAIRDVEARQERGHIGSPGFG